MLKIAALLIGVSPIRIFRRGKGFFCHLLASQDFLLRKTLCRFLAPARFLARYAAFLYRSLSSSLHALRYSACYEVSDTLFFSLPSLTMTVCTMRAWEVILARH